jgi:hypothetical protein
MIWFDIADVLLPPVYQAIKDMYAYARTLDTELREALAGMVEVRTNFFIQTCDEQTLQDWENLLGISSYTGETIEERRQFVLMYLNNRFPTSEPYIRHVMDMMFGESNYRLEFDETDPFRLHLNLFDTNYEKIRKFLAWFAKMCPAHIQWLYGHIENTQATNYISCGTTSHETAITSATASAGYEDLYLGENSISVQWIEV